MRRTTSAEVSQLLRLTLDLPSTRDLSVAEQFEIARWTPTEEAEPFQPPPRRLTLTVEEAATTLGISRASAY